MFFYVYLSVGVRCSNPYIKRQPATTTTAPAEAAEAKKDEKDREREKKTRTNLHYYVNQEIQVWSGYF